MQSLKMMGSRGKELPPPVMDSKSQMIVVSDPTAIQVSSQITGNEFVATGHVIQTPIEHTSSTNHNLQVNRTLRPQLLVSGNNTTPIASMIEEMQGRFAQLDSTQRRQLLEWMMSNLDGGDLVTRIQTSTQQTSLSSVPVVEAPQTQLPTPTQQQQIQQQLHQVQQQVQTPTPQPQSQQSATQQQQLVNQQQSQALSSYPRNETLSIQGFPTALTQLPWSGTKIEAVASGGEVLGVAVPGMNFETSSITTGATINYVPLVASHSTSGVTYATPVYTTELPTEDQNNYQQGTRQTQTGLPQGARVIAEATITNSNRESNVIIPGSSSVSSTLANQILDTAGIVSMANAMVVQGSESENGLSHVVTSQTSASDGTVQPLLVIKHVGSMDQVENSSVVTEEVRETKEIITINEDGKAEKSLEEMPSQPSTSGFRGKKRKQRRRSPCAECKKYFHLVVDESKKVRIWREKTHVCPTCNKIFRTRAHLKVHERIHTGIKPYVCSICNKGFAQSSAAKAHTLLHAMPKPFVCPVCGKSVTTKGNLKLHMALHSGSKPFKCTFCQKTFPRKSNLDQHVLVHTGEKPYGCQYCGKKFRTVTSRTTHERIHTGEKPYTCKYCNKSFSDKRNLTSHEKIHTGGYPCTSCGKHFSDRRRLKAHHCQGQQGGHLTQIA